ncbi:MAG: monovalent cation/H(+) antiporter subunit G [Bacillota bacterium]
MWDLIRQIAAAVLISGGFFFLLVGSIGLIRLPDVYNRMHAVGKCDTLGNWLMLVGLMLLMTDLTSVVKLALIFALVATINPVITHVMAKTAYERGMDLVEGSFVLNTYSSFREEERRRERSGS